MSLYITLTNEFESGKWNIGYRGKVQIPESLPISSWPKVNEQPARKSLCYWNGSNVELKTNQMLVNETITVRLNSLSKDSGLNWVDSPRNVTQLKEQYDLLKSLSSTWTTVDQVNTEVDNFYTWLGIPISEEL